MKIRNKLFLINAAIFILFTIVFSVFIFSAFTLLDLKDLEREAAKVRLTILELEYANNAILNSENLPLHLLDWAGQQVEQNISDLKNNPSLRYLDKRTKTRIEDIEKMYIKLDFKSYFQTIAAPLTSIRPELSNTTAEILLRELEVSGNTDDPVYILLKETQQTVRSFIIRHFPISEVFRTFAEDIIAETNSLIRRLMIQTGITMLLGIIISLLIILLVFRNMIGRLNHVRDGIERISSGDLQIRIDESSKDEMALIAKNFNFLTSTIWQKLENIGTMMHDLGQSLTDESEKGNMELNILEAAMENTKAESGAFYIPDYESRVLSCQHKSGYFIPPYNVEEYGEKVPFGKTVLGMSVLSGEPLFLKDTTVQNLVPTGRTSTGHTISSCILLPLISEKQVIGILCLEKNSGSQQFTDMDFRNIQSFIEFAAVTLNNLTQYNELLQSSGLNREMEIASDIQKSLLPPRLPRVRGFDLTVKTYSLKGISGDIYDFFPLGQNRWLFCIAEVMEKGIASSMLLVILRTLVRILVGTNQEPAEMMNSIMDKFRDTTGLDIPLKISLLLMDSDKKQFEFCGTEGQNLLLYDKASDQQKIITARQKGPERYITVKGSLRRDVFLLLMTDGFYETTNESGKIYGWDPAKKILRDHSDKNAEWLQDAVNRDLEYFERNLQQRDDRTLFLAKFKGAAS